MLSFALRLGHVALEQLALLPGAVLSRQPGDLVHLDAGVPHVEVGHPGQAVHRLTVGARHRPVDRPPLLRVEAPIPPGHGEAGHEPFHVPLERPRQRLVEVVDAEHQPPVGRGEPTEVGQMRIAAELHLQSRARGTCQVGRHRIGRAAEEGERRDQHPPVAEGPELRHPGSRLLLQHLDGITPVGGGLPFAMLRARRQLPCRLSARRPLRPGGVRYRARPRLPAAGPLAHGHARELVVPIGDVLDSRHGSRSLRRRRRRGVRGACGRSIGSHHTAPRARRHRPDGMNARPKRARPAAPSTIGAPAPSRRPGAGILARVARPSVVSSRVRRGSPVVNASARTPSRARSRRSARFAPPFELLESKLRVPRRRSGAVQRKALIGELEDASPTVPVVFLSAGPGWGKTTLLAQWSSRSPRPFAWVSIDEHDNDAVVLLAYVAAALDRVTPLDPSVFEALESPGTSVEGTLIPRLGSGSGDDRQAGRAGAR